MVKRYPKQVCFKYDVTMKFEETAIWQFAPSLNFSDTDTELINAEIPKVIHKNVFLHTVRKPNDYISGIFIRIKRDGSYRMIINLERFNEIFEEMKASGIKPNRYTFSVAFQMCAVHGDLKRALKLVSEMKQQYNFKLDTLNFNSLLKICIKTENVEVFNKFFDEMKTSGVSLDCRTFGSAFRMCAIDKDHMLI